MNEFTFLGTQFKTHFFLFNAVVDDEIKVASQLYNVLIHTEFIVNVEDNVVVYVVGDANTIVIIKHDENPNNNVFVKENLLDFLPILLNVERKEGHIVMYDRDRDCYVSVWCDAPLLPKELPFHNSNVVNVLTSKPVVG